MTFHKIVRQWCKQYKYMLDSPENRRFYLTDTKAGMVELAKGITPAMSPCVVMESAVEGGGEIKRPTRNYPIYFFVRARLMSDGDAAAEAKEEAWMHAQNFLTWLVALHEEEVGENTDGDFARIELDDAYLDFMSIDPLEDGWYAVLLQIVREEPLNLCVNPDLYELDAEDFDGHGSFADEYLRRLKAEAG